MLLGWKRGLLRCEQRTFLIIAARTALCSSLTIHPLSFNIFEIFQVSSEFVRFLWTADIRSQRAKEISAKHEKRLKKMTWLFFFNGENPQVLPLTGETQPFKWLDVRVITLPLCGV